MGDGQERECAPLALAPLPLIFSYKSEKPLCGTGHRLSDLGWSELRPLTKSFAAVDRHITQLRNEERERLQKQLQAEMAADEARKNAQKEAKHEVVAPPHTHPPTHTHILSSLFPIQI